jgi:hypothetical protein
VVEADSSEPRTEERGAPVSLPQWGLRRRIQTLLRHNYQPRRCEDIDVVTGDLLQRLQLFQVGVAAPFAIPSSSGFPRFVG